MFYVLGIIFLLLLWVSIDLKIGRFLFLRKSKRLLYPERFSSFELITEGHDLFKKFFDDIRNAKDHIHILIFIIRDDNISAEFLNLICLKSRQGVKVRILLDKVGGRDFTKDQIQMLNDNGVEFDYSNKPKWPLFFYSYNKRNHRKIFVIDGEIGYIGGFNVGDEYLGLDEKLGFWRDYHLRMIGEGVQDLQKQFFVDWEMNTKTKINDNYLYYPKLKKLESKHRLVPTEGAYLLHTVIELVNKAEKELYIATPYYVPGRKVNRAIISALKRGVKVVLLTPLRQDHKYVHEAAYIYYRRLMKHGCEIYFYKKGFIHAKVLVLDDNVCDVGTANFDLRSLYSNNEINCIIEDTEFSKVIRQAIEVDLEESMKVKKEHIKPKNFIEFAKEVIGYVLAPFL
ncbi:MAG: cardiolipin synthetase domain protein [Bacillales bacterium]|jgi:cardiolipin synthase|nr:cardiolipin synthetase domain protein [Bacillales bacterium]